MKIRPTGLAGEPPPPKLRETPKDKLVDQPVDVRVKFTQAARLLSSPQPEEGVDLERALALRERIRQGSYSIDDQALAKAILEREEERDVSWKK